MLDEIEVRFGRASPPPWKVFLEEAGGIAGSNVIWVSDHDDEPDLCLWLNDQLAPGANFEFVAAAPRTFQYWLRLRGAASGEDFQIVGVSNCGCHWFQLIVFVVIRSP